MQPRHAELLERITLGELSPEDPSVLAARASDADFDLAVEETLAVLSGLDAEAAEQAAVLADAAARTDAPGEALVAPFVRARVGGQERPWLGVVLAAAVLLAIALPFALAPEREAPTDPNTELGAQVIEAVAPVGGGQSFARFEWTSAVPGGSYEVRVYGAGPEPLVGGRSERIEGTSWTPDPNHITTWPDDIEWELHWYDGGNAPDTSASFSASR